MSFLNHMNIKAISDLIPKLILNSMDTSILYTNFQSSNDNNSENQTATNKNEFNEIRNDIITKLFLKLNLENDIETTNNIVNICIELMENKTLLEYIANDEVILGSLFKNLAINLNLTEKENRDLASYNYKEILILILNLMRFSLIESIKLPNLLETSDDIVNFNCSLDQNKIKNTPLGKLIIENINQILQNFLFEKNENEKENDTTYGIRAKALGYKR